MKIYDKVRWHIDDGEDKKEATLKIKTVLTFLDRHFLLNNDGKELLRRGINENTELTESIVTNQGRNFLNKHYIKRLKKMPASDMERELERVFSMKGKTHMKTESVVIDTIFEKYNEGKLDENKTMLLLEATKRR